jgi:hypothetical protein
VEPHFQEESGLASFVTKVAPSLKGVDPSFYELICWILLVKPSGSNILHDTQIKRTCKTKIFYFQISAENQSTRRWSYKDLKKLNLVIFYKLDHFITSHYF